jgi:hypothetical protein
MWRGGEGSWLTDARRRRPGVRRQLAKLVARRHGSTPVVAASGVEACTAAPRERYNEEKMSFALSWTTTAMDKAALGGACGFGQKRWVSVGHVAS